MTWIHSTLMAATVVVGFLVEPRAQPAQSSATPCLCRGHWNASVYSHPCIASTTTGGGVKDGRCHRPPPSDCSLLEKACQANLTWSILAKTGCTPHFEVWVDGALKTDAGTRSVYNGSYNRSLWCGEPDDFVTIKADGVPVLTLIVECDDCD